MDSAAESAIAASLKMARSAMHPIARHIVLVLPSLLPAGGRAAPRVNREYGALSVLKRERSTHDFLPHLRDVRREKPFGEAGGIPGEGRA